MSGGWDRPADLVLTGGPIHTLDAARSTARALAVREGRIVALGDERAVERLVGPSTRRIGLRGRCAVPGFVDAHVHPIHAGLAELRCELHGKRGLDTYLGIVRAYAEQHPEVEWIQGGGWSMDDFPGGTPTKASLDAVVPDRPVFLDNRDGHGAWVNSRALELAGVTRDTPDPPDGRIERDASGAPSGTLHEGAQDLVERLIPPDTAEDVEAGLRLAQRRLHELGITGWQDAWLTDEMQTAYERLAGRGELTARVVGALWWDRDRGVDQIPELLARRTRRPVGRFRPTSVKIMLDGVLENFTGAVLEDYLDAEGRPSGRRGIDFVPAAVLAEAVPALDAAGVQVHFHAIGERAVRHGLDAVEAARRANGWTDTRPHIAHIQVIHPDDVPRFAALGVVANAQPYWAVHEGQMDTLTIPFLGPERSTWQYPFRSLRRAGAIVAGGSDWAVSTANPLLEIEVMSTRVSDETRDAEPFLPDERLDPIDALAAFTAASAWVNHAERETGSLEVGKAADLAIVDRDILDPANAPIGAARVLGTWIEGVAVWEDPALDG
jgi:predicted amidohydrolase YtcJ